MDPQTTVAVQFQATLDELRNGIIDAALHQRAVSTEVMTLTLECAVPRWFDTSVVAGMRRSPGLSTDQILSHLVSLPFCEPHPTRDSTWIFKEDFRESLLQRKEVKEHWQELQTRAAHTFKRMLDGKNLEGAQRFKDPDWTDVAAEWVYHLLQSNPAEAIDAVRRICAQALGVWTSGEQPEVIFCSEFLGSLNWTNAPEEATQYVGFLRAGINALLTDKDPKAVPMLQEMAEVPGLSSEEQGVLQDWIGRIYLEDEERYAPALEHLIRAEQLIPTNAYVQGRIAELYYWPDPRWARFDLAQQYANRSIELSPDKSNGYYALGNVYKRREDWDRAIATFQRACEVEPNDYSGCLGLSEVYSAIGNVDRALFFIDQATQASPDISYYALIRKGNVYIDAKQFSAALDVYEQAIAAAPDRLDGYIGAGNSQTALWRLAEAEEQFEKAIKLNADDADAYEGLAALSQAQGRWDHAIAKYEEAIAKGIRAKNLYVLLQYLYSAQNRLADVKRVLEQLVSFDPGELYRSHCLFGDALLEQVWQRWDAATKDQWLEEARSEFENALAVDPRRAWAHMSLAQLAVIRNDQESVKQQRQLINERSPWAEYDMLVDLGIAYLKNFQHAESKDVLELAANLSPRRTGAWEALSEWYYKQGEPQGVIRSWSELVKINPTRAYDAHLNAGYIYEEVADYESARAAYARAIEIDQYRIEAHRALATLEESESNLDKAVELYRTVEKIAPALASWANIRIAGTHVARGNFTEAENALRAAIRVDPGEPLSFVELARLGAIRQRQDFIREGREGVNSASPAQLNELEITIGDTYRERQHYKQAKAAYEDSIASDPEKPDAYIGLARLSMEQNRLDESEKWLKQALALDSRSVPVHQALSQLYQQQGNLARAIETEQRIAWLAPIKRYEGLIAIGQMYEKVNQLDGAEREFRAAIDMAGWRSDAYVYLGSVLVKRGKSVEAQKVYKEASDKARVDYFNLGAYYERKNRLEDAEAVYRLGTEYAPEEQRPDFYLVLGNLYTREQQYDRAEESYGEVIKLFPDRAYDAYGWIGDLRAAQQHYDQAEKSYRRAIAVDPHQKNAYVVLARMLADQQRWNDALKVCEQMAQEPENAYDAHIAIGDLQAARQLYDQAEKAYQHAIRIDPQQDIAYITLAQMLADRNRLEEAIAVLRQMAQQPGLAYDAHISIGNLRSGQGLYDQAARTYRQSIELNPKLVTAYLRLAHLYQEQNELARSELVLRQALEAVPDNLDASMLLAELRERQQDWNQAIKLYRRAVELQPRGESAPAALERMGSLLFAQKNYAEAEEALQEAINLNPKYGPAYETLSRFYGQQKDTESLERLSRQLLGLQLSAAEEYDAHLIMASGYRSANATRRATSEYRIAINLNLPYDGAYLELGSLYVEKKRYDEAEKAYRQAIEVNPQHGEAHVELARTLVNQNKWDEALAVCRQMAQQPDLAYDAYISIGNLYAGQNQNDEAENAYRRAITIKPHLRDAYDVLVRMFTDENKWEAADAVYRQMVQQPDLTYDAYIAIGNLHAHQKHYEEAEKAYRQAIAINSEIRQAYTGLAQILASQQRWEDAVEVCRQMAQQPELAYEAHTLIGYLRSEQEHHGEAVEAFQHAINLNPKLADAYLELAFYYQQQTDLKNAEKVLRQAVTEVPSNARPYYELARLHEDQTDWEEAIPLYRQTVELQPGGDLAPAALERIATLMLKQENHTEAQQALQEAIRLDPKYGPAYTTLARLYGQNKDIKSLLELSRQISELKLTPNNEYEARLTIAEGYQGAKLYEESTDELNKAIQLVPGRWEAYVELGRIYELQALWSKARDTYKRLLPLFPEYAPDLEARLGHLWELEGNYEEAEKGFRQTIALAPKRPEAYFALGLLLTNAKRWEEAIEVFEEVAKLGLDEETSASLQIAAIYRSLGKTTEMQRVCRRLIKIATQAKSSDANILRRLGMAQLMLSEYETAAESLRLAIKANDSDVRARLYLAMNLSAQGLYADAKQELEKGIKLAKSKEDYVYPIEEAEAIVSVRPEDAHAKEILEALRTARDQSLV